MLIPISSRDELPDPPRIVKRKGLWKSVPGRWISGWVLLGLGLSFCITIIVMQYRSRPGSFLPDITINQSLQESDGKVTAVILASKARSRTDDTYRIEFLFELARSEPIPGFCYTKRPMMSEGDMVWVEYCAADPELARIKGTNAGVVSLVFFPLIGGMTLIGLLLLLSAYLTINGMRTTLVHGKAVMAKVTKVALLKSVKVNNISPWQIAYSFMFRSQRYIGKGYSFPKNKQDTSPPININDTCVVLYDIGNPKQNALVFESDFEIDY